MRSARFALGVSFSLALALMGPKSARAASAAEAGAEEGDGEAEGAVVDSAAAEAAAAKDFERTLRAHRHDKRGRVHGTHRHKPLGWVVPETKLRATPLPAPSGNLELFNIATRETLKINLYNEDGSYNPESLAAVTHLLRCKRTNTEKAVDPRLMTVLSRVYDKYQRPIQIVSGYRNQRRTTSFHYHAAASDIRVAGVEPKKLRNFVDTLDTGGMGIGLYPRTQFVHVDVRPLPSYRWVDYARSDPDSPGKQPPRGWRKKRKLQS